MKKTNKLNRSYKNYIIPVVLTVIMLSVISVFAVGYISENTLSVPTSIFSNSTIFDTLCFGDICNASIRYNYTSGSLYLVSAEISPVTSNLNGRGLYSITNYTIDWNLNTISNAPISGNGSTSTFTTTNTKLNDSGYFVGGNKINLNSYDYIVARGTSAANDLALARTATYVCKSTDTDCQPMLQNTLGSNCNNKRILWLAGNYPVITRNQVSNTMFLYAGCSNFTLDAYGAILNVNYTSEVGNQKGFEVGNGLRTNVHINGLEIIGNKNKGATGSIYGLRLWSCKDCTLTDTKVSNVNGFQYTVESVSSSSYSENVKLDHIYGRGIGVADIIGGGSNDRNVIIVNSRLEQWFENGSYGNAIDLVNLTGFTVMGTTTNGGLLVGSEEGNSVDVHFIGNTVYPPYNSDGTWNTTSIAFFGFHPSIDVSNSQIIGNTVYDNLDGSGNLSSNNIFGNTYPLATTRQTENYLNNLNFAGLFNASSINVYGGSLTGLSNTIFSNTTASTNNFTTILDLRETNAAAMTLGSGIKILFTGKNPNNNFNGDVQFSMGAIDMLWTTDAGSNHGKTDFVFYSRNLTNPTNAALNEVMRIKDTGKVIASRFEGVTNWSKIDSASFPVACPAGSFVTQINNSITCTAVSPLSSPVLTTPTVNGAMTLNVSVLTPSAAGANDTRLLSISTSSRGLYFTNNTVNDKLDSQGIYRWVLRTGDNGAGWQLMDGNTNTVMVFLNLKNAAGALPSFFNSGGTYVFNGTTSRLPANAGGVDVQGNLWGTYVNVTSSLESRGNNKLGNTTINNGQNLTITSAAGTGDQFACFDSTGKLFRSASACA